MRKNLELNLLKQFICTADKCPQSCCSAGWAINVDSATRSKWQLVSQQELKTSLLSSITGARNTLATNENHGCVHLNDQDLCHIQNTLGHEYLPQTCQEFPRLHLTGTMACSNTAQLSCPEIVRLVLETPDTNLFSASQTDDAIDTGTIDATLLEINQLLVSYYDNVVSHPEIPPGILLYDISCILIYLTKSAQSNNLDLQELNKKCGKSKKIIRKRLTSILNDSVNHKLEADTDTETNFWQSIFDLYQQHKIDEFEKIFKQTGNSKLTNKQGEIGQHAPALIEKIYRRHARKNNLNVKLHRLLQVKFHNHGFPWRPFQGNYTATFLDVVLPFTVMILLLCMLDDAGEEITDALVQKIVYKVERNFTHNLSIFELLQQQPVWTNLALINKCFLRLQ